MTDGAKRDCYALDATWAPDSATFAYIRNNGHHPSCTGSGVVVQHPGQRGRIVVPGMVATPSFTPAGTLVYIARCGDSSQCGQHFVAWEAHADGTHRIMVGDDDCQTGDFCSNAIVGAPSGRGWVQIGSYTGETTPALCFQGAYQQAGAVTLTDPQFCLDGITINGYAVA
jgi:hypothetical protein